MNYDLFYVKFSVKSCGYVPYRYCVVLILLVSEILKIPSAKAKAHFLKKLAFEAAQDALGESPRATKKFSKYLKVHEFLYPQIFLLSRIFYKAILVSEPYRLPRHISPYKWSLN